MKTKPLYLLLLPLLLLTACLGGYDDDSDQVVLMKDNFIYEGDLHSIYLNNEISMVGVTIDSLQLISDNNPGDMDTQKLLDEKLQLRSNLKTELAIVVPADQLGIKIRPTPPLPPCFCIIPPFEYLLVAPGDVSKILTMVDLQGNVIGSSTGVSRPLKQNGIIAEYQKFILFQPQFSGDVIIRVETSGESYQSSYSFNP